MVPVHDYQQLGLDCMQQLYRSDSLLYTKILQMGLRFISTLELGAPETRDRLDGPAEI